jgi:transposase InsO family protein
MKYLFMEEHREIFRLKRMSKVLKVSRSGYYAWRKRRPSRREEANRKLLGRILEVYRESRNTYGSPRITNALNEQGIVCGKNRVARIMRDSGIRVKIKRRFKRTTDSTHGYPVAPNLLIENKQTERLWVSDITFIRTREGWMYLSAVMNVGTRKIIGFAMRDELSQELVMVALKQALDSSPSKEGLIHHSDRGRQYATYAYQGLLQKHNILSSMSRKGHCYDNAYMESFFATLKKDLVHGRKYQTREEASLSIFEYVEVFYNRIRKHSSLGYKSPVQYEKALSVT